MKNVAFAFLFIILFSCNQKQGEVKHETLTDSIKSLDSTPKNDSVNIQSFDELDSLLANYFNSKTHNRKRIMPDSSYKKDLWNKDADSVYRYRNFLIYEYADIEKARKGFTELEKCWKCLYADDGKKKLSDNPECKKCWAEHYFSKSGGTYFLYKNIILRHLRACSEDVLKENEYEKTIYSLLKNEQDSGIIMLHSRCGWGKGIKK